MDIDRPLDDLIPKRKPKPRSSTGVLRGAGGGGADRSERRKSRGSDAPYARPPPRSTEEKWVHDAFEGSGRKPSLGAAAGHMPVTSSPRIEVSGVHYEVTPEELESVFEQAGTITHGPEIRVSFHCEEGATASEYDRSGRSTGVCVVEYSSPAQAKSALNQFDGAMMKGQTITIKLIAPPRPRGDKKKKSVDGNSGQSLLARLGQSSGPKQRDASRGDRSDRPAPRRGDRGDRGGPRGERGRGGAQSGRGKRAPASAADLDAELAGFMKSDDVAM